MESNFSNVKILIVEDVDSSLKYYETAFKMAQADILITRNGNQAVEAVKNNPDIDIVLMDINMPEMNGLEATTSIRAINPKIFIIIQTAYVIDYSREKCMKAGCDVYLTKPISLKILFNTITELLNKK